MNEFQIKVTQVFRVEKHIVLTVEADTLADAIEAVDSRETDVPSADDDVYGEWVTGEWSLQNEIVEEA